MRVEYKAVPAGWITIADCNEKVYNSSDPFQSLFFISKG